MAELTRFAELFRGRADVWGSVEGKSNKEPVTEEHYRLHLEGKKSLGIYPLLDDGTCYFWAVDIDDKSFEKALAIRNAMNELELPMYICESKSKGYHVYGFCQEGVQAADIRWVLFSVLEKLGWMAEVFPKQDKLDQVLKYGNYINLPCFGNTRLFQTIDKTAVPTAEAIKRIKTIPIDKIREAKAKFPPPPVLIIPLKAPGKKSKKPSPPCVETLLKGVNQGCRDEAAFALARHYLDQLYTPEEVMSLMLQWDSRNRPPIGDQRILQTKLQSAQKGYAFGCSSIKGDALLSVFCPGENKCTWLQEAIKEKKKKGLIIEKSFYETDDYLYEEIADTDLHFKQLNPRFFRYNLKTGETMEVNQIEEGEVTIVPTFGTEAILGAVLFPSGATSYGSTEQLFQEIFNHLQHYVDIPKLDLEQCCWYIIMSWCPLGKMFTVPYLRFRGDTGTGKSRCLDAIGRLCYKPLVVSGAITPAPIYRIITKYGGTVILDEADLFLPIPDQEDLRYAQVSGGSVLFS